MADQRLTHAQWWALMHIFQREGATQAELAEIMQMGRPAAGKLLESGVVTPEECLRYALSLPTSVVITGCETVAQVEQALRVGLDAAPLTDAEVSELLARTAPLAAAGAFEPYKTTDQHDGTIKNPQWLTSAA